MWRPKKGWKNPFNPAAITVRNVFGGKPISHNEAFEYGADAMLEALMRLTDTEILIAVKPNWDEDSEEVSIADENNGKDI